MSEEQHAAAIVKIATGVMWMLILLGIGGCGFLLNLSEREKPLISITTEKTK